MSPKLLELVDAVYFEAGETTRPALTSEQTGQSS